LGEQDGSVSAASAGGAAGSDGASDNGRAVARSLVREQATRAVSVGQLLDEAPMSRYHLRTVVVSGMGFFTDAYCLFVIGVALSLIKGQWHLRTTQVSAIGSATLFAAFLGAVVFGRLADVLGRKRVYAVVAGLMIAGGLAGAAAPGFWWLLAARFVLGIGIGGDYPVSAVLMSEYANRRHRGRLVGLVFSMQALGLIVGPAVGLVLLASGIPHEVAWRLMLGLEAVPAAAVLWLRTRMPESPRYQARVRGQATTAVAEFAAYADGSVRAPELVDARVARLPLAALVRSRRLLVLLVGTAGAWFLVDYAFYGNTISTPLVLKGLAPHASLAATLGWSLALFSLFALPGYVLAFASMDAIGHRRLQVLGFGVMAVAFALLGAFPVLSATLPPFLALYGVSYLFTEFGPNTTTFVLPSEVFPVSVRTTGHGIAAGVGKLGAFVGVFLFPVLEGALGLRGSFLVSASASVLGVAVSFLLPEPARRSLEEVSREDEHAEVLEGQEAVAVAGSLLDESASALTRPAPVLAGLSRPA
jgi:PHS family inorganic phosphate transporter-like MFS transporter